MSRYLPVSDISYPTSVYGGGPPFWSLVNKLVPDDCPGANYLTNNVAGASGQIIEFGLPTLSAIPATCALKLYALAGAGQIVDFAATAKQSGTAMFQASTPALPTTEGEIAVALPLIGTPSSDSGWSIELNCGSDTSSSQFWIYGVEVDFTFAGGGGVSGQTMAWMQIEEQD